MARIDRILITLCTLPFATLPLTSMAHTSEQTRKNSATTHIIKEAGKKKSMVTTQKAQKVSQKTAKEAASKNTTKNKIASSIKKSSTTASKNAETHSKHAVDKVAPASFTEKCTKHKGYKPHCAEVKNAASRAPVDTHKAKVQKTIEVAMDKLMQQIGKPYRWGGSSPCTDPGCSGLVYYTYRDLVKIRTPRAANEMYHLRDAASVERSELKSGDPVFFRTQGRGTADHVGMHISNGKSIQSPCTGQETQITSLSEDH